MSTIAGRRSPWGPMRIADAHVHFFSHKFFSTLVAQKPGLTLESAQQQLGWELPDKDPAHLASRWVAELDRHGVNRSAIIASIPGDESSVTTAAHAHADRLIPYAMVNPKQVWVADAFAGVRVACLFPAMHGYSIHDECVTPVLEWARRERRVVFVHCGVLSVGVRKKLGLPSPFDLRFSNPIDLHNVAQRYPDVPFVVPHFGAGFFREALMLADLCPNVYFDTSSSNEWTKYQTPVIELRDMFRQSLSVLGPARLLFGSDSSFFPRGWNDAVFESQATALYELGVGNHDAHAIFGENLLRILSR
ncbi:MAG: amidohydrolase family protein [Acidobacteriota bacterium]